MKSYLLKHLIEVKNRIIEAIEKSNYIAKNDFLFLNDIIDRIETLKIYGFDIGGVEQ